MQTRETGSRDAVRLEPSEREAAAWCRLVERLGPTVAHDLRGPLNALGLHLELLRRVTAEGVEPPSRAERVQRSIAALDREVARLVARIEGMLRLVGPQPGGVLTTRLGALLEECGDDLRTAARHRGVALRVEVRADGPLRQREELRRALWLLAWEALEVSAEGDAVSLSGDRRDSNGEAVVAVRSSTSASRPDRQATDLAIVRSLVARCGGEVEREGSGAEVSWLVRFPIEIDS